MYIFLFIHWYTDHVMLLVGEKVNNIDRRRNYMVLVGVSHCHGHLGSIAPASIFKIEFPLDA